MAISADTTRTTISALNRLLRGEMSAVNAYDIGIESLDTPPCNVLRTCRNSHSQRCAMLRDRILLLGDEPADGPGIWGTVTTALTNGAVAMGDERVIALLEQGEDHGLSEYAKTLRDEAIDESTYLWISEVLHPEQLRTHRLMNAHTHSAA